MNGDNGLAERVWNHVWAVWQTWPALPRWRRAIVRLAAPRLSRLLDDASDEVSARLAALIHAAYVEGEPGDHGC